MALENSLRCQRLTVGEMLRDWLYGKFDQVKLAGVFWRTHLGIHWCGIIREVYFRHLCTLGGFRLSRFLHTSSIVGAAAHVYRCKPSGNHCGRPLKKSSAQKSLRRIGGSLDSGIDMMPGAGRDNVLEIWVDGDAWRNAKEDGEREGYLKLQDKRVKMDQPRTKFKNLNNHCCIIQRGIKADMREIGEFPQRSISATQE